MIRIIDNLITFSTFMSITPKTFLFFLSARSLYKLDYYHRLLKSFNCCYTVSMSFESLVFYPIYNFLFVDPNSIILKYFSFCFSLRSFFDFPLLSKMNISSFSFLMKSKEIFLLRLFFFHLILFHNFYICYYWVLKLDTLTEVFISSLFLI